MRLFCCCIKRNPQRRDTASIDLGKEMVNAQTSELHITSEELRDLERPSEINMKLEVTINAWEQAIHDYEEMETTFVDAQDNVVISVLPALRSDPSPFLNSPNANIRKLAARRNELLLKEKALSIGNKPLKPSRSSNNVVPTPSLSNGIHAGAGNASRAKSVNVTSYSEATKRLSSSSMQRRISKTWAAHMEDIDSNIVQNASVAGSSPNISSSAVKVKPRTHVVSRIRPKWPEYLLDVSFEVLKVNSVGSKLRRTMKLTEYHILNIKEEGNQVSKAHKYIEISQIWLETTNVIKIKLKDGTVLTYISPIASHIVQQISTRVKTRLALNKTVFSDPVVDFGELPASIEHLIAAINAENSVNSTMSMHSFANELASKFSRPALSRDSSANAADPAACDRKASADSLERTSASSSSKAANQPKIYAFSEQMVEHRVQEFIRKTLFDSKTDEGSTRADFVSSFAKSGKALRDIRSFVDGMHNYILTTRGIQLAEMLVGNSATAANGAPSSSSSTNAGATTFQSYSFGAAEGDSQAAASVDTANGAKESQEVVVSPMATTSSNAASDKKIMDLADLDSASIASISFIVFTVVEESVFLPLSLEIKALLPSGKNAAVDEEFVDKMKQFSSWGQVEWGIKNEFISPLRWQNAVFELSALEHHFTPSMHLLALSRCMNAIYSEYKLVVLPTSQSSKSSDTFLGADDLVPIFIYVMSKSELRNPIMLKEQMWALCHPQQLIGESGYYLTVLESAIEFIRESDPSRPYNDNNLKDSGEQVDGSNGSSDAGSGSQSAPNSRVRSQSSMSNSSDVGKDEKRLSGATSNAKAGKGATAGNSIDGEQRGPSVSLRPKKERGMQRHTFD